MKKFKNLYSILALTLLTNVGITNNLIQNTQTNVKFNKLSNESNGQINSATSWYFRGRSRPKEIRPYFFLSIQMTGDVYNYVRMIMKEQCTITSTEVTAADITRHWLYSGLFGTHEFPFFSQDFAAIKTKVNTNLNNKAEDLKLPDNYFQKELRTWFESPGGFNEFCSTFLVAKTSSVNALKNLFWNYSNGQYVQSKSARNASSYYRKVGFVMNIPFITTPSTSNEDNFLIDSNNLRTFPQDLKCIIINHYYLTSYYPEIIGPALVVNCSTARGTKVKDNLDQILNTVLYVCSISSRYKNLIKVENSYYDELIPAIQSGKTLTIKLDFQISATKTYLALPIRLASIVK